MLTHCLAPLPLSCITVTKLNISGVPKDSDCYPYDYNRTVPIGKCDHQMGVNHYNLRVTRYVLVSKLAKSGEGWSET